MPFICIGPVCIPWTAVMPILLWLAKPIWVRLPPHVQDAVRTRYAGFQTWMQATVWDRVGWKAKPKAKQEDAATKPLPPAGGDLLAQSGTVVGVHSEGEWEAALQLTRDEDVALVVDFTATWCGPCQKIAPHFASLAKDFKGSTLFIKVDVDELDEISQAANVLAMPTFQVYKKGEMVDSMSGANPDKLTATVKKHA